MFVQATTSLVTGKLTLKAGTWVGILTYSRCPREGNLTEPPMPNAKKGPREREFDPKVLLKGGEIDIWLCKKNQIVLHSRPQSFSLLRMTKGEKSSGEACVRVTCSCDWFSGETIQMHPIGSFSLLYAKCFSVLKFVVAVGKKSAPNLHMSNGF